MCLISPTQLSWLPVLSNIASPLRRKVATDNMLQIIKAHPNWAVYADVFERPPLRLASWCPIWSDMTSVDTVTQWREDWSSASVVDHIIVTDPTIWQPGFHLPCHTWSLLNHFKAGQGPCFVNVHKWGLAQSPSCDCGQQQTVNHIVDTCPLTKFEGGLNLFHDADDNAVIWLESTATAALTKWKSVHLYRTLGQCLITVVLSSVSDSAFWHCFCRYPTVQQFRSLCCYSSSPLRFIHFCLFLQWRLRRRSTQVLH